MVLITDLFSQQLDGRAEQETATRAENYRSWINSHTVSEIIKANEARTKLFRRASKKGAKAHRWNQLTDPRIPKRLPVSPFSYFFQERSAHGVHAGVAGPIFVRQLAAEWKNLTEAEKQVCSILHDWTTNGTDNDSATTMSASNKNKRGQMRLRGSRRLHEQDRDLMRLEDLKHAQSIIVQIQPIPFALQIQFAGPFFIGTQLPLTVHVPAFV